MFGRSWATVVVFVLAVAAGYLSLQLLTRHTGTGVRLALLDAMCGGEEGSTADCDEVIRSPYGYWPPLGEGETPGAKHVPAALLGLIYYGTVALWMIGVGRPSPDRRWVHGGPLLLAAVGVAMSGFYTYVMLSQLEHWCPLCAVTHVLNLLIFIGLVLMVPRKQPHVVSAANPGARADAVPPRNPGPTPRAPHPGWRHVTVTLVAVWLLASGLTTVYRASVMAATARAKAKQYDGCAERLASIQDDAALMARNWQLQPKQEVATRPDDPIRGGKPGERHVKCVVFSDFQCPSCRGFARFVEERVEPLFDGNLAVVFKHYPLGDCNGQVQKPIHPHACQAVRYAEAARMQGGNDAFWAAHDFLFENQRRLGELTPKAVAEALGLDPVRLEQDLTSEEIARRLWEDINEAARLKLRGTPTILLSGRRVDPVIWRSLKFWNAMADSYWRAIGKTRPEHTRLVDSDAKPAGGEDSVTPDTRDQPDEP
jgi:protein-disulfide isomerase/uncharacterized membrane protein